MKELLYLVHRIPYPPNKGDKIRSFHVLEALASRYRVHLGTFIDAPEDREHEHALKRYCATWFAAPIDPFWRRVWSLKGLLSGKPLTEAFYRHRPLAAWCRQLLRERQIERIVTFSSSMAQFVPDLPPPVRRVMDFCDIDSDKWRQYASHRRGPSAWIYNREAQLLERLERSIASRFDASVFVSEREAATFRSIAPESADRVCAIRNGVDLDYFDPAPAHERPSGCEQPYVVFTGAMDYWANVEGVTWFAKEVWPFVLAAIPDARFLIVGSRPATEVLRLASERGVSVTGSVPDIRPYLAHAHAAVAPLRVARGIQNKVLEAMAMERVVVTTTAAVQGIDEHPPGDVLVADDAQEFGRLVSAALRTGPVRRSANNRSYVTDRFHWSRNLATFLQLVEEDVPAARAG
jgi:sugar transferase (PEP-CTERM/EpsH1 system associated)